MDERVHCTTSNPTRQQAGRIYLVANRTGHQHWMRIEMVIPVTREFQLRSLSTLLVVVGGFAILFRALNTPVHVKCHYSILFCIGRRVITLASRMEMTMMMMIQQRPPFNRFNCESISFAIMTRAGTGTEDEDEYCDCTEDEQSF